MKTGMNKHGQPFSKKQKKASRMMMANRRGFTKRDSGGGMNFGMEAKSGMMAAVAALLFGAKLRRKAS